MIIVQKTFEGFRFFPLKFSKKCFRFSSVFSLRFRDYSLTHDLWKIGQKFRSKRKSETERNENNSKKDFVWRQHRWKRRSVISCCDWGPEIALARITSGNHCSSKTLFRAPKKASSERMGRGRRGPIFLSITRFSNDGSDEEVIRRWFIPENDIWCPL